MDAPKEVELSQEQEVQIRASGLDPQQLLESITEELLKTLPMQDGVAKQNVLVFLVDQELAVCLDSCIEKELEKEAAAGHPHAHNPFDNSSRVEELREKYSRDAGEWEDEEEEEPMANIDKRVGPAGQTALHIAALNGKEDEVQSLLDQGADPHALDDFGLTPLDRAKGQKNEKVIGLLEAVT